jgi:hypothetical protein
LSFSLHAENLATFWRPVEGGWIRYQDDDTKVLKDAWQTAFKTVDQTPKGQIKDKTIGQCCKMTRKLLFLFLGYLLRKK